MPCADPVRSFAQALADDGLVQSFSGVRTVFGSGPSISDAHSMLARAYGYCYARRVLTPRRAALILGMDPRPTGEALGKALCAGFVAGAAAVGCELSIVDLGIITTPLAETAVRSLEADGGVMVTASHNPLEFNGFKFLTGVGARLEDGSAPPGALLSAAEMAQVMGDVVALMDDAERLERIACAEDDDLRDALSRVDNESARVRAERAYLDVTALDWGITPHCLKPLVLGPGLLDPNGGAGCGIDARVLEHFGVRVIEINAELGYPEHAIDTDGIDPASGRHMLLRVARAAARENAHFGIAFDYDADRGNLVLPGRDESAIIAPQRVAAFNIAMALARRRLNGGARGRLAVVLSEATSLASERVARAFGAEVFVVETGEINVVTRMHLLREEGYDVPVGVEGANGGTIFETSTCRDGLQAALSAALAESQPEVSHEWARVLSEMGEGKALPSRPTLAELIDSVPANPNVFLKLSRPPIPNGEFKRRVEEVFAHKIWPQLSRDFECYEFQNFERTGAVSARTGDESGGWRVILGARGRRAFIFLRGSKTEAGVWRMIVDADDEADFGKLVPLAREMFDSASRQ